MLWQQGRDTHLQGENFQPEYLKINPNGTVPTYISNGKTYTDSIVSSSIKSLHQKSGPH